MTSPVFYVHHLTGSDGSGVWEGSCPPFPRMTYCSDRPSEALEGIRRFVTRRLELETQYGS